MPNSFTVFPNVLPGNVTIGGNLTVGGDQVRIGAAAPFTRVGKASGGQGFISANLGFDEGTRDDATKPAFDWNLDTVGGTPTFQRANAAGILRNEAIANAIFTDYTAHAHTGTTTEDTIYAKTIPANTLGANGGIKLRLFIAIAAQGAGTTNFRVRLGASLVAQFNISNSTDNRWIELYLYNTNAANAQNAEGWMMDIVAGTFIGGGSPTAVDTTADQALTVTVQNSATTDSQTFRHISVHQLNSFGPV